MAMKVKKDEETLAKIATLFMLGLAIALWLKKPKEPNQAEILGKSQPKNQTLSRSSLWYSAVFGAIYALTAERLFTWTLAAFGLAIGAIVGLILFLAITLTALPPLLWLFRKAYRWWRGSRPWRLGEED